MRLVNSFILLFSTIFLLSCSHLPSVQFEWPETKLAKEVDELKGERKDFLDRLEIDREKVKQEILNTEKERYSKGTSQVYAAEGTLQADEVKNKYTKAAIDALSVAKEALPTPTVEDLLKANETQKKLLSEQAEIIAKGKEEIAKARGEVIQLKNKEEELKTQKETLETEKIKAISELTDLIEDKETAWQKEKDQLVSQLNAKAIEYDKQNSFWAKINPFDDLARFATSIFWWIVIFIVLGAILKISSVFFPGSNIIGVAVNALGRIIGSIFGVFTKWIPGALRGMNAIDYKEFKEEKLIANNTVGAIQELKNEKPDLYKELKPYLLDWFKDTDGSLIEKVDKKIKELNLK